MNDFIKVPAYQVPLSAAESLAKGKRREAQLIARIDAAIGMAPKLQNPPVYQERDAAIDYHKLGRLMAYKYCERLRRQREREQRLAMYLKRRGMDF